jgi:hypothetical protein
MIYETWKGDITEKGLPCHGEDFNLANFLSNEVEISRWSAEGLPTDELSV